MFLPQEVQKCKVSLRRLASANSKVAELEAEKEGLQAALGAKDEQLWEGAQRNAILVTDLEKASAEVDRLTVDLAEQSRLAVDLSTTIKEERAALEATLKEKAAELESALAKQKAKPEERFQAELGVAYEEGIREVTMEYKAQIHKIRQKAWELGWIAALRKAGVPEDDPTFRNPPKF